MTRDILKYQTPMSSTTPIVVNIEEWQKERAKGLTPTLEEQKRVRALIIEEAHERDRADKLETLAHECFSCGQIARNYKDDYICWVCREALDKE